MDGVGKSDITMNASRLHKQVVKLRNVNLPSWLSDSTKLAFIEAYISMLNDWDEIWAILRNVANCNNLDLMLEKINSDTTISDRLDTLHRLSTILSSNNQAQLITSNTFKPNLTVTDIDGPPTLTQIDSNDACISTYVEIFRKIQINQNWQYEEVKDCFDALLDWFEFRFVKHRKSHLLCKLTELPKWINTFILAYGQTINNGSKLHDFKEDINEWKQSLLNDDDFGYALPMSLFYKSRKMINTCTSSGLLLMLALYRSGFDMLDSNATLVSLHTNTELSVVFDTANSIRGSRPEFNYLYDIDTGMFSANSVHHYIESGFTPIS